MEPKIDLIPLREALSHDAATTLDLVVRITPPAPEIRQQRRPINLSLVLDRSGSMIGEAIVCAKAAAKYAVEQLLPTDRISIVSFDDSVEVHVANQLAQNKSYIYNQIDRIFPRKSTALHAGWLEGAFQVSEHLQLDSLNRVVLLSDGMANVGETNPDVIGNDARRLANKGVSTTTMGVGNNYDEILLEAMALTGDGNYYYIESPKNLPEIFGAELQGLIATVGRNVSFKLNMAPEVELLDVFNDFERLPNGSYQLPNLIAGSPFSLALRLRIPPQVVEPICSAAFVWDDVKLGTQKEALQALSLPWVSQQSLEEGYPLNADVQREVALLLSARAKKEAANDVRRGHYQSARQRVRKACMRVARAPMSGRMRAEMEDLDDLDAMISPSKTHIQAKMAPQAQASFVKKSHYQSHQRSRGHNQSEYRKETSEGDSKDNESSK